MTGRARFLRWAWLGAALLPSLLLAATVAAGVWGSPRDAPSDAAPPASPPPPGRQAGRPAHLHAGACREDGAGPIIQPLAPVAGAVAARSFTSVPLRLEHLLARDHVVDVHAAGDDPGPRLACGELGGALTEDGALVVGLREVKGSGLSGVAILAPGALDPATIDVSVLVAADLVGDGRTPDATDAEGMASPTGEPAAVPPAVER